MTAKPNIHMYITFRSGADPTFWGVGTMKIWSKFGVPQEGL